MIVGKEGEKQRQVGFASGICVIDVKRILMKPTVIVNEKCFAVNGKRATKQGKHL